MVPNNYTQGMEKSSSMVEASQIMAVVASGAMAMDGGFIYVYHQQPALHKKGKKTDQHTPNQ